MNCQIIKDINGSVQVYDRNGNDSQLYNSLIQEGYEPNDAVDLWSLIYTDTFKEYYGDFVSEPSLVEFNKFIQKSSIIENKIIDSQIFSSKDILNDEQINYGQIPIQAYIRDNNGELIPTGLYLPNISKRLERYAEKKEEYLKKWLNFTNSLSKEEEDNEALEAIYENHAKIEKRFASLENDAKNLIEKRKNIFYSIGKKATLKSENGGYLIKNEFDENASTKRRIKKTLFEAIGGQEEMSNYKLAFVNANDTVTVMEDGKSKEVKVIDQISPLNRFKPGLLAKDRLGNNRLIPFFQNYVSNQNKEVNSEFVENYKLFIDEVFNDRNTIDYNGALGINFKNVSGLNENRIIYQFLKQFHEIRDVEYYKWANKTDENSRKILRDKILSNKLTFLKHRESGLDTLYITDFKNKKVYRFGDDLVTYTGRDSSGKTVLIDLESRDKHLSGDELLNQEGELGEYQLVILTREMYENGILFSEENGILNDLKFSVNLFNSGSNTVVIPAKDNNQIVLKETDYIKFLDHSNIVSLYHSAYNLGTKKNPDRNMFANPTIKIEFEDNEVSAINNTAKSILSVKSRNSNLRLTEDEKHYYDNSENPLSNELIKRVSSLTEKDFSMADPENVEKSRLFGKLLDLKLTEVISGVELTEQEKIDLELYNDSLLKLEYLQETIDTITENAVNQVKILKEEGIDPNEEIVGTKIKLFSKNKNVAGETDFITVNRSTNKTIIYDIKTSSDQTFKESKYVDQLSHYAGLLSKELGIDLSEIQVKILFVPYHTSTGNVNPSIKSIIIDSSISRSYDESISNNQSTSEDPDDFSFLDSRDILFSKDISSETIQRLNSEIIKNQIAFDFNKESKQILYLESQEQIDAFLRKEVNLIIDDINLGLKMFQSISKRIDELTKIFSEKKDFPTQFLRIQYIGNNANGKLQSGFINLLIDKFNLLGYSINRKDYNKLILSKNESSFYDIETDTFIDLNEDGELLKEQEQLDFSDNKALSKDFNDNISSELKRIILSCRKGIYKNKDDITFKTATIFNDSNDNSFYVYVEDYHQILNNVKNATFNVLSTIDIEETAEKRYEIMLNSILDLAKSSFKSEYYELQQKLSVATQELKNEFYSLLEKEYKVFLKVNIDSTSGIKITNQSNNTEGLNKIKSILFTRADVFTKTNNVANISKSKLEYFDKNLKRAKLIQSDSKDFQKISDNAQLFLNNPDEVWKDSIKYEGHKLYFDIYNNILGFTKEETMSIITNAMKQSGRLLDITEGIYRIYEVLGNSNYKTQAAFDSAIRNNPRIDAQALTMLDYYFVEENNRKVMTYDSGKAYYVYSNSTFQESFVKAVKNDLAYIKKIEVDNSSDAVIRHYAIQQIRKLNLTVSTGLNYVIDDKTIESKYQTPAELETFKMNLFLDYFNKYHNKKTKYNALTPTNSDTTIKSIMRMDQHPIEYNPANKPHLIIKNGQLVEIRDTNNHFTELIKAEHKRIQAVYNEYKDGVDTDGEITNPMLKVGKHFHPKTKQVGLGAYYILFPMLNKSPYNTDKTSSGVQVSTPALVTGNEKLIAEYDQTDKSITLEQFYYEKMNQLKLQSLVEEVNNLLNKYLELGLIFVDSSGNYRFSNGIDVDFQDKNESMIHTNGFSSKNYFSLQYNEQEYYTKPGLKSKEKSEVLKPGTNDVIGILYMYILNNEATNAIYHQAISDPSNSVKFNKEAFDLDKSIEITIDNHIKRGKKNIAPGSRWLNNKKTESIILIEDSIFDMQKSQKYRFDSIVKNSIEYLFYAGIMSSQKPKFQEVRDMFNALDFKGSIKEDEYVDNIFEFLKTVQKEIAIQDNPIGRKIITDTIRPIFKSYKDINTADAAEYEHISIFLDEMVANNNVTIKQKELLDILLNDVDPNNKQDYHIFTSGKIQTVDGKVTNISNNELRNKLDLLISTNVVKEKDLNNYVLGIVKNGLSSAKNVLADMQNFVKTAKIPFIPRLHLGTNLYSVFESNQIKKFSYTSGSKLASPVGATYTLDENNRLKDYQGNIVDIEDMTQIEYQTWNYLHQLNTHGEIHREQKPATQIDKTIFQNFEVWKAEVFLVNGEFISGETLLANYLNNHGELLNSYFNEFVRKNKLVKDGTSARFKNLRSYVNYIKSKVENSSQKDLVSLPILNALTLSHEKEYNEIIQSHDIKTKEFKSLYGINSNEYQLEQQRQKNELDILLNYETFIVNPSYIYGFDKIERILMAAIESEILSVKEAGTTGILVPETHLTYDDKIDFNKEEGEYISKDKIRVFTEQLAQSDSIIWTNGVLSELGPKDVIIPFCFKCGETGRKLYIEDFLIPGTNRLDMLRLPKDAQNSILRAIGYRIPLQGQNLISSLNIVGFVPTIEGSSLIASKELIAQFGHDHDIDKVYISVPPVFTQTKDESISSFLTLLLNDESIVDLSNEAVESDLGMLIYHYENKEYDKATEYFQKLKPYINADKVKIANPNNIQAYNYNGDTKSSNTYLQRKFDLRYALLSHPMNEGITFRPNQYGDLVKLSEEINGIYEKGKQFNPLSPLRVSQESFVGQAGKLGVSFYSDWGSGFSKCQFAEISTSSDFIIKTEFGERTLAALYGVHSPFNYEFISANLNILGAILVDNQKLNVSGKLNLDNSTFGAYGILVMLGVPLNEIVYLMNHPIIRKYFQYYSNSDDESNVKAMNSLKAVLAEYTETYNEKTDVHKIDIVSLKADYTTEQTPYDFSKKKLSSNEINALYAITEIIKTASAYYSIIKSVSNDTNLLPHTAFETQKESKEFDKMHSTITNEKTNKEEVKQINKLLNIKNPLTQWNGNNNTFYHNDVYGHQLVQSLYSKTVSGNTLSIMLNENINQFIDETLKTITNKKSKILHKDALPKILKEFNIYLANILDIEKRNERYKELISIDTLTDKSKIISDFELLTSKNSKYTNDWFLSLFRTTAFEDEVVLSFSNPNKVSNSVIHNHIIKVLTQTEKDQDYRDLVIDILDYFILSGPSQYTFQDFLGYIPSYYFNDFTSGKLSNELDAFSIEGSNKIDELLKGYFSRVVLNNKDYLPAISIPANQDIGWDLPTSFEVKLTDKSTSSISYTSKNENGEETKNLYPVILIRKGTKSGRYVLDKSSNTYFQLKEKFNPYKTDNLSIIVNSDSLSSFYETGVDLRSQTKNMFFLFVRSNFKDLTETPYVDLLNTLGSQIMGVNNSLYIDFNSKGDPQFAGQKILLTNEHKKQIILKDPNFYNIPLLRAVLNASLVGLDNKIDKESIVAKELINKVNDYYKKYEGSSLIPFEQLEKSIVQIHDAMKSMFLEEYSKINLNKTFVTSNLSDIYYVLQQMNDNKAVDNDKIEGSNKTKIIKVAELVNNALQQGGVKKATLSEKLNSYFRSIESDILINNIEAFHTELFLGKDLKQIAESSIEELYTRYIYEHASKDAVTVKANNAKIKEANNIENTKNPFILLAKKMNYVSTDPDNSDYMKKAESMLFFINDFHSSHSYIGPVKEIVVSSINGTYSSILTEVKNLIQVEEKKILFAIHPDGVFNFATDTSSVNSKSQMDVLADIIIDNIESVNKFNIGKDLMKQLKFNTNFVAKVVEGFDSSIEVNNNSLKETITEETTQTCNT